MEEVEDSVKALLIDANGNYVIFKMMECFPLERVRYMLNEIEKQVNVLV
jgi:hypothetical protein